MKNLDKGYNLNGSYKPTLKRFADLEGPDFYPTPVKNDERTIDAVFLVLKSRV